MVGISTGAQIDKQGNEMEAKHTATPWHTKPSAVYETVYALEDGELICFASMRQNAWANAAFIVRACNAHDDLVAALKGLIRAGHGLSPSSIEWNAAHAALAKATS